MPTIQEIRDNRTIYSSRYPGDIYYHAATALVTHGIEHNEGNNGSQEEVTIGLAVLLVNWNTDYYRRYKNHLIDDHRNGRYLDQVELEAIKGVVHDHWPTLIDFRGRHIQDFTAAHENSIREFFARFHPVCGPVGTAMSLHLIGPNFFPFWNNKIAKGYGIDLENSGINERPNLYCRFMRRIRDLLDGMREEMLVFDAPLKAIDEYNLIKY
jgi:hypothetical protein